MKLAPLVDELRRLTKWQRTPQAIEYEEHLTMIINGIKYLYALTGRDQLFREDMFDVDTPAEAEFDGTLNITEELIVMCAAQIEFYEKVRADKNAIVGYTTDALSVTNADKPFQYLTGTIEELQQKIRTAFYKLTPYAGVN